MHSSHYFRYTAIGYVLRTISGGRILPHVKSAPNKIEPEVEIEESLAEKQGGESEDQPTTDTQNEWLVDWDGPDDPTNPKNFSVFPQVMIGVQVRIVTVSMSTTC